VILDFDSQAFLLGIERGSARDSPRLQHTVDLQSEIIVKPCRIVLLDDEAGVFSLGKRGVASRLRRAGEASLGAVIGEAALLVRF